MNERKNPLAHCLKCKKDLPGDRSGICKECYIEIFDHEQYRCKKCGIINIRQKECPFCSIVRKKENK